MLFGAAGMAFSMAVLAIMVYIQECTDDCGRIWLSVMQNKYTDKGTGIVAALFLFIFNTFFAIGWLGMTWLYPAEIVPLRIRAPANALSTSANWVCNS